jgi:hypothetical protein
VNRQMERTTESATYNSSVEHVYTATLRAGTTLGYTVLSGFPEAHVVSFATEASVKGAAWLTATVIQDAPGIARVVVGPALPPPGDSFGRVSQQSTLEEKMEQAALCLRAINSELSPLQNQFAPTDNGETCPWCDESTGSIGPQLEQVSVWVEEVESVRVREAEPRPRGDISRLRAIAESHREASDALLRALEAVGEQLIDEDASNGSQPLYEGSPFRRREVSCPTSAARRAQWRVVPTQASESADCWL